jgi:hypothetical protein
LVELPSVGECHHLEGAVPQIADLAGAATNCPKFNSANPPCLRPLAQYFLEKLFLRFF